MTGGAPGWEFALEEGGRLRVSTIGDGEIRLVVEPNPGPGVSLANGVYLNAADAAALASTLQAMTVSTRSA